MKKKICFLSAAVLTLSTAGCGSVSGQVSDNAVTAAYETSIFDASYVHEINVDISEADWADLLADPTAKTKYSTTVTIDGTTLNEVSFATKGNTSLSQVSSSDSDRYSFKLNFGKFVEGQTYDGLDKLNLNNAYGDATYIKDYLSFRIMAETGVCSPLVSFAALYINGEYYGLYTAIEEVGDSFLERNYGAEAGELYKPENDMFDNMGGGGRGNVPNDMNFDENGGEGVPENGEFTMPEGGEFTPPEDGEFTMPEGREFTPPENGDFTMPEDGEFTPPDMKGFGGFGGSSEGAGLIYTDDSIESYSDIFNNAETDATEEDFLRVIAALKQLSTGEELDMAVDTEATLRYFAAHNFVINYDSYTGSMLHNYYLYEEDGKLTMLPWDYNLAFGSFNNNTATEDVNWPIDSPLATNVSEEDRPMWGMLAANEEYLEMYHSYLDELITNYFDSGRFEEEINAVYDLIRPYIESDPTAFYTVEEFDTAIETLQDFCLLRAESVRGQLDGTIPSTSDGQQADSSTLINADKINTQSMGGMNMGGGAPDSQGQGGGQGRMKQDRAEQESASEEPQP